MLPLKKVTLYVTERFALSQNLNGLELAGTKMHSVRTLLGTTGKTGFNIEGKVEFLMSYCLPSSVC